MRPGRFGKCLKPMKYKWIDCRISDPAALPDLAKIRQTQPRRGRTWAEVDWLLVFGEVGKVADSLRTGRALDQIRSARLSA